MRHCSVWNSEHVNVAQALGKDALLWKRRMSAEPETQSSIDMEPTTPVAQEAPLQRLPPELRNEIYQLVISPGTSVILEDGKLIRPELSLLGVCRELRKECLPIIRHFLEQADKIEVQVTDFNFDKLIPCLNRLPTSDTEDIETVLEITLRFTDPSITLNIAALVRWLKATKTGSARCFTRQYYARFDWSRFSDETAVAFMEELSHHYYLVVGALQEYDSMQTMCWHNIWATRMKAAAETRRRLDAEGRAEGVQDVVTSEV